MEISRSTVLQPELGGATRPDWLDQIVDGLYDRLAQGEKPALSMLLEGLLNRIMERERDRFLAANPDESGNGFYNRQLALTMGRLNLKIPRVRYKGGFRPAILPARWKRVDKDYEELLVAMLANGYSQAQLERACHALDLPFSQPALDDAKALVHEKLDFYRSQPLSSDWFAIFLDAYWAKLRTEDGRMLQIALFVALGIDLDGNKSIVGFWPLRGRESRHFWVEVLQDLLNRGVHRVLLFVTDDFSGLRDALPKIFPGVDHQLCLVHLQRNLRRILERPGYAQVREALRRVSVAHTRADGEADYDKLCTTLDDLDHRLAQDLRRKRENYLAFLHYPEPVRQHIYSTNPIESVNAGIERMRIDLGGYFPSEDCLNVNLFIQAANLQDRWWTHPVTAIRQQSYALRQLFAVRFQLEEDPLMTLHNF